MLPADIDTTRPNIARIYDYWLGGKDHFEADRVAAEAVRRVRPDVADLALENKKFLTRAVTYVAGQGVRQFVDIGSGLPTSPMREEGAETLWRSTHEAAQAVTGDAVVAYVDYDPVAVLHSQVLLAGGSGQVVAVAGDMRDPQAILTHGNIPSAGFSLGDPACVILGCVLHFLDAGAARNVTAALAQMLAPGSYLIISVGYGGGRAGEDFAAAYNSQDGSRIYSYSREEVTALFGGLEVLPPGIVDARAWRPDGPETAPADRAAMILAGVGRRA
jgi:O-methyltransferase involved in polyketide biosynthesis